MTTERDEWFLMHRKRLEHMASNATIRGMNPYEFLAVLIDADDRDWSNIVESLMPGYDWQAIRDRGEKPFARGIAMAEGLTEYLSLVVPDIVPALRRSLPAGMARAVVMGAGGASVYEIVPTSHYQDS